MDTAHVPREEGWSGALRMETPMGPLGAWDYLTLTDNRDFGYISDLRHPARKHSITYRE